MRKILVIFFILVYKMGVAQQQKPRDVDTLPVFILDKQARIATNEIQLQKPLKKNTPHKQVQETLYRGQRIRLVTEYDKP